MTSAIDVGLQGIGQTLRVAWFLALNRIVGGQTARLATKRPAPRPASAKAVPSSQEILIDLAQLIVRDAAAVREGLFPPMLDAGNLAEHWGRAREMLSDLPGTVRRREAKEASTSRELAREEELPAYYAQDFHFQTGGYLTEQSARLYDVQVETLFLGGAGPMRREALRPIAQFMRGRDQRQTRLLDVACGTGRFLRDCRMAWPALRLMGVDLSPAYIAEARRHMRGLRPAELICANAETLPIATASQDILVSTYFFHELPAGVRRRVAAEMARVLKPGGMLVFIDSLQLGDRPHWDGLLEAFPVRFHEPYYRDYISDDLDGLFRNAGLEEEATWTSYFSRVMVRRRPA